MISKNPSDNQKYFPDRPSKIRFWEGQKEFNLALSVIIDCQDKKHSKTIEELQDEIIRGPKLKKKILFCPYTLKNGLYKYPKDNLHFTLINFFKCKCDFSDFGELISNKKKRYEGIQDEIIKKIKQELPSKIEVDVRWIFSDCDDGIDSFTLQAFPREKGFIQKMEEIMENIKQEILDKFNLFNPNFCLTKGIKAYPKQDKRAFAINILRFLANSSKQKPRIEDIVNRQKIINLVGKINERHTNEGPLLEKIKIKEICLVESDAFLHKWKKIKCFSCQS